ncbi:A disintegrin and metalloproteinase with thrombospondin motifs 16-like [Gigantopelta aegis]|uniref:A disintegrin and metalloproteinase with thrombospondin motifs 16-like n=1 Tax=Gigantopelta aegis TaxID=1735272 RepID=UPI001B88A1D1|nr:A disintegrin and metalloproteinase with thrombospondin motifs 16-like [Gigantopelta aegis]
MKCSTCYALLLLSVQCILLQYIDCGVTKRNEQESKHWVDNDGALVAAVTVHGDPTIHNQLLLKVSTFLHDHHITVTRVRDSVFHDNLEAFIVTGGDDNITEFHIEDIPSEIHSHGRQFFSNRTFGTIVSITLNSLGKMHVEGIINDEYVIAPPGSQRRHRRALPVDAHSLLKKKPEEGSVVDYIDVPKMFQNEKNWKETFTRNSLKVLPLRNSRSAERLRDVHRSERSPRRRRDTDDDDDNDDEYDDDDDNDFVVVEALVIIDVKLFKQFDNSIKELGVFLLHFWHAVAFKFRTLSQPRIKLKLKQYGAFSLAHYQPFIENNRIKAGAKEISLYDTLDGFRDWMRKYESNHKFVDHDIAFLHTGEDLCEKQVGSCNSLTSGIGYVKGACITANAFPKYSYDAAISEVGKSFKGVLVTVHELGHLLGAHHDGEADSAKCPVKSGYVMSYQRNKASQFSRFSRCSKASIRKFINKMWYSKCLRETGTGGYSFPKILPGKYMSLEEQCRNYVKGTPCPLRVYPLEERCERLCCESGGYRIKRREPAVDGTACGHFKVCLNGECVLQSAVPS